MAKKAKTTCPICNSNRVKLVLKQDGIYINRCLTCDLQFVWPQPSKEFIKRIYSKKYFFGNTETPKGYEDYIRLEEELSKEAKKKISYIDKYNVKKNLLDLGCATGIFLEEAKKHGYKVSGNEISSYALKILKQKKFSCYPGAIESGILPKNKFDVVTAWDVMEHIPKINKATKEIAESLKKGGYLFITTPNTQSLDSILMRNKWYNYKKAPEHLLMLNKKSFSKLFEINNLKLVSTKSWGFYRNLNFFIKRLQLPPFISNPLLSLFKFLKLSDTIFFFPFTDFMVVAKKV